MTEASKEDDNVALARVPFIHYLLRFQKDNQNEMRAFIDSGSEVNKMTPAYALKLGFQVRRTNVGVQKIHGSILEMFGIILASFQVKDKLGQARFFQETFLLADLSVEVVLEMPFLTFSNADI